MNTRRERKFFKGISIVGIRCLGNGRLVSIFGEYIEVLPITLATIPFMVQSLFNNDKVFNNGRYIIKENESKTRVPKVIVVFGRFVIQVDNRNEKLFDVKLGINLLKFLNNGAFY